jgi:hypothetical protein
LSDRLPKPNAEETEKRQLGEYRLRELRGENTLCWTWLAEQVSVSRLVLVDELRTNESENSAAFLANCRAKASVEHPLIGSVFEAVAEPGLCFYAHELLAGSTLAERAKSGRPFKPSRLAVILRRIADANLKHESLDRATSPLSLEAIHLEEHGVVRLKNLAIAGERLPSQSMRDVAYLGAVLTPLLATHKPGAKRLAAVLGWMRGEGLHAPITWAQVRGYCLEIERQLNDDSIVIPPVEKGLTAKRNRPIAWIIASTVAVALGILGIAIKMRTDLPVPRLPLPAALTVPAGEYLTLESTTAALGSFQISANETTIGQYAEFLAALEKSNSQNRYDSPDQPQEKSSHLPDDWAALLAAAQKNSSWNGQAVTLDSPVVGVDWWDAAAYAAWKSARLPTQDEWFAAYHHGAAEVPLIQPGNYLPVTGQKMDRTAEGLIGMAGSVAEWSATTVQDPNNPLGERVWIIIGGSYQKPKHGAQSREWTSNRSQRRKDIGFRIAFDVK